jgi:hypothetical protein
MNAMTPIPARGPAIACCSFGLMIGLDMFHSTFGDRAKQVMYRGQS